MAQLRRIDMPLIVLTMLLLSLVALVPVVIRPMTTGSNLVELLGTSPASGVSA